MKLKNKKRVGLNIDASLGYTKKVKQLQSYFMQGGIWKRVKFFVGG